MLWRIGQNRFLEKKKYRQIWFQSELKALRSDLASLAVAGGGTGVANADADIKKWCPRALE
eukprot:725145-Karenia_brevis.AAC.1